MAHPGKSERRAHSPEVGRREVPEGTGRSPRRRQLTRVVLLTTLSAAAALLAGAPVRPSAVTYPPGEIAREDVRARRDFLVPDEGATELRRRAAEASSPSVYDLAPDALAGSLTRLVEDLEALGGDAAGPDGPLPFDAAGAARRLQERWDVPVSPAQARRLAEPEGRRALEGGVRAALEPLYVLGVAANRRLLLAEARRGILVRDLTTRGEVPLGDPFRVRDFDELRQELVGAPPQGPLEGLPERVAGALLRPNLTLNSEETAARRDEARRSVKPVLYPIRRGEMLVREGDRVSPEQARKLAAHAALARDPGAWRSRLSLFLLSALVVSAAYGFGRRNVRKFRRTEGDLWVLAALGLAALAAERLGLILAPGLAEALPGAEPSALAFALPLAGAVIAARALLNSETALLFSLPYFALAAVPFEEGLAALLCFAAGGLVGADRVARACHRADFLRAGVWAGAAQAAVVGCWVLLRNGAVGEAELWWIAGAFVGGALAGVVALCLVALAEWVFGSTTEMRLMELASLDHPLLRELMLRAPGTYHHSIVTGSLVKAAAEAIGARALLATVAAYYHDIGKVSKPVYFIENQGAGRNPHDKLAPRMSSLILISHVKEGVELARRHRLGPEIVSIIQQHHGTGLIRYFYEKACLRSRGGVDAASESDYRYPGPKPQSREAALVLLADAVEAACRTVADPRPARIRGAVQNIVNRTFADGQLDECDLTLSDLHRIARSFSRILCAIHHQRIDYPLTAQKEKAPDADLDPKRLRSGRHRRGEARPASPESLRRLGM